MRIGFFGGTFNPVHQGHLLLAREAVKQLHLDHLQWIPAKPWQKTQESILPDEDRVKMLQLAIEADPNMSVNTMELQRQKLSYSIDTLRELQKRYPQDERFYLIGADQWENFHTWKDWQALFDLATFVIFERDGQRSANAQVQAFLKDKTQRVLFLTMPAVPVCSTELRSEARRRGLNSPLCRRWIPESVRNYMILHHLFAACKDC